MLFRDAGLEGVYVIEPELRTDGRGFFARVFCKNVLSSKGIDFEVVQINHSLTKKKGSIRGMHFQKEPKAEDKIISCLKGSVHDVVVDLRKESPTFGKWTSRMLGCKNGLMIYIPKGLAHGFQTLEDDCMMQYLMSEYYSPQHASGVRYDDPFLKISWPLAPTEISAKDKAWPLIGGGKK